MSWRWSDRLALACAWSAGLGLCLIAGAIVIYMGYRGRPVPAPEPARSAARRSAPAQAGTGGFLDPLLGTAAADR